jgi:hypothetical protein
MKLASVFVQGSLNEGEGSVWLTSLLTSVDQLFLYRIYYLHFYKTSYLKVEVNRTEPSPTVSAPWFVLARYFQCDLSQHE